MALSIGGLKDGHDAPGHEQYTRNMVEARATRRAATRAVVAGGHPRKASTSALFCCSQTRPRHALLAQLLRDARHYCVLR
jgi:sulfate adenylyltransferase subunit 1 (EFTu-like GTPase family)